MSEEDGQGPGEAGHGPGAEPATAPEATAADGSAEGSADGPDGEPTDPRDEELRDLRERLLRARADYDNLKRRVERDAGIERDRVRAKVLEDFLQVYEYGRMAAVEAERHPGALAEGVKMVVREFERLLDAQGVRPIGTPGEPFDAQRHDAVGEEPGAPGTVLRVAAPGYLLGDRVLRYAKVIVGCSPAQEEE